MKNIFSNLIPSLFKKEEEKSNNLPEITSDPVNVKKVVIKKSLKGTRMKILVFDDNKLNCEAALTQLRGHDLTIAGSYDNAQEALIPRFDERKFEIATRDIKNMDASMIEKAREDAIINPNFDVVLTDLLVPASRQQQGSMKLVGQEMPIGIFIGLLAAVRAKVPYVAVFTDSDHHSHPASACFDAFNYNCGESEPISFKVEDSDVLLVNNRQWIEYENEDGVAVKNWAALLDYLVK